MEQQEAKCVSKAGKSAMSKWHAPHPPYIMHLEIYGFHTTEDFEDVHGAARKLIAIGRELGLERPLVFIDGKKCDESDMRAIADKAHACGGE